MPPYSHISDYYYKIIIIGQTEPLVCYGLHYSYSCNSVDHQIAAHDPESPSSREGSAGRPRSFRCSPCGPDPSNKQKIQRSINENYATRLESLFAKEFCFVSKR